MATLSKADKENLSKSQQAQISALKDQWAQATTQAERDTIHAEAEGIRAAAGYSGGADGRGNTSVVRASGGSSGGEYTGSGKGSYELSAADSALLDDEQQAAILKLKEAYAAAVSDAEKQAIHQQAEEIRATKGYKTNGSGTDYVVLAANQQGGRTADDIQREIDAYIAANSRQPNSDTYYGPDWGWKNGYSVDMNKRSMANLIRQQMDANSKAWHNASEAEKEYLHDQNVQLAEILRKNNGGAASIYNETTGRWETWNPNLGYGYDMNGTQPNIRNSWKSYYKYTDDQIENWANDTSRYYNFVDASAAARNTIDESSGFTGRYAQFVNGPYASLMGGSRFKNPSQYEDVIGDNFGDEGTFVVNPDANGNIAKSAPALKNNNSASAYNRQFSPVAVNGILAGQGAKVSGLDASAADNNTAGQMAYYQNYGNRSAAGSGVSGSSYEDYLQQIYASALEAQLKVLESSYAANLSELNLSQKQIDAAYAEQKRLTSGESDRQSAAWREMANAYGLNSGAVGQASLAQRNQLQSDLNKLNAAQASARTELQRQRLLLGQQYQLAIEQAVAENNSELARSLYEEAVRAEEALQQQEQFYANLALQYSKSMMSFAKNSGSGKDTEINLINDAVKNGYISDAQAMALAESLGLL